MDRVSSMLALVAALVASPPAFAHEEGGRVMGVVESASTDRLVVKAADGHSVPCAVTPETRFFQGDAPARREDVRVGQRVVVHGRRDGETLRADRVKLGAMAVGR